MDSVNEAKERDESGVSAHDWKRSYVDSAAAPAAIGRKRKYNPLSSAATDMLRLHFHAWQAHVTEQRTAPELVTQARLLHSHFVWQRWRDALLLHRADTLRTQADEQSLTHALHEWSHWRQRRKLSHAAFRLARRHHQLFSQTSHLSQWVAALQDARDERHQLQTAAHQHKQHYAPNAVQRWRQLAAIKRTLLSDAAAGKEWRRRQLAAEALSAWRQALHKAALYRTEAVSRLRPLRLRSAIRGWQQTARVARSATVSSGPFLHAAFLWLQHSFEQPLPFSATPSSSTAVTIRPSRRAAHDEMLQVWRCWQLQRFHAAWRDVVARHIVERVKLSHCQRLQSRQLLETAWQRWKDERARKERRRRRALAEALSRWRQHVKQRKAQREQVQTATLVDKFGSQRCAFRLWEQRWRLGARQREELDRQNRAQLRREEHEALVERQMQQHADTFHYRRLLSLCLSLWHSRTVQSLVNTCTLDLAASHCSSVGRQWALQRWWQWQQQRKQHKAEVRLSVDRADVMYVGRLLSVMLVCWRVQLARKQSLSAMQQRREQREQHDRWQRWRLYVRLCQQQRRQQRDEEERQRREDNHRKGQLIVQWRLQSAWTVWRNRMAVVSVGQLLCDHRRLHSLQRVMSGWWEALRQKRQLAATRRTKLQQLLSRYVVHRQHVQAQRMRAEVVLSQQAGRRRVAAVFAVWKQGGLRRLQDKRRDAARDDQLVLGRAVLQWQTAVQQGKRQLGAAAVAVERGASVAVLTAALQHWRHALYLRSLHEQLRGPAEDGEEEGHLSSFAHWRQHCLIDAWRMWRNESTDRRLEREAVERHRNIGFGTAISHWRRTTRQAKQQRQSNALSRLSSQRFVFAQWRHSLSLQRQERRAAESLQSTLTTTSLPFIRPLLLSILHPHLPSQPAAEWFHCWRAYIAHRQRRLQVTTAAYQLYHQHLLASAFGVMLAESRTAAHTASFTRSLAQSRLCAALHDWHERTQQRSTARTVVELSSAHHTTRLVSGVLSAWRRQSRRGAARRLRCAEVERGVDALVVHSAFQRWRAAAVGERRRQRMFTLSHAFLVWKWQILRLRERRQLLHADQMSSVAAQTQAVAVRV